MQEKLQKMRESIAYIFSQTLLDRNANENAKK